jgi:HlyD family secretion protein
MTKLRLLLPAIFLFACAEEQSSAPIYDKAAVERHSISVSVGSSGAVEPLAKIEVKSKASGEVLELLVATGDYVEQGALMVNIDPRTVTNRLAQAEAELKAALSRQQISISQMARAERLAKQGTFTEADYEQAALELANAEAQVVTTEVAVENARIAVDDTDIRAPVSGTVIAKPVEKGQVISSPTQDVGGGTLLLTMADLSAVQIRALVDETDIGKIRAGMQAEVTVAAYPNQPFPGEVIKIEPQAVLEQNVTMFAVLISIRNPEGLLMPGMNAEVEISVARRNDVLAIPVMALRTERDVATTAGILGITETELRRELAEGGDKAAAAPGNGRKRGGDEGTDYRFGGDFWVVIEEQDGGTRIANVKAGLTDLDRVEIISGLEENDRVFILPSAHLVETQEQLQKWINRRVGSVPGIGSN